MALHHLLYISRARIDACGPEVKRILEVARARNAQLAITGLLIYSGDHFAQLLEGPPQALSKVMDSIRLDARHAILLDLPDEPIAARRHAHWSLGYVYDDRLEHRLAELAAAPGSPPSIKRVAADLFSRADFV